MKPSKLLLDGASLGGVVAPVTIKNNSRVMRTETLSMRTVITRTPYQRWDVSFTLHPADAEKSAGRLEAALGWGLPVHLEFPQPMHVGDAPNTSVTASGAVSTNSFSCGSSLQEGEYISFGNHSKVYIVVTGGSSPTVYPLLRQAVPIGTTLNRGSNVLMKGLIDDTDYSRKYVDGVLSETTLTVKESL
jgi:hypothetical protein